MIDAVHLLDDFAFGGVTRALSLFDRPELAACGRSTIVPVGGSKIASHYDASLIVTHFPPCWSRLGFLASLRLRNPRAMLVHVEHSYTRCFVKERVSAPQRFTALLRLAYSLYDRVVCVSEAQRNWLAEEVGVPKRKLRVIHPWCGREELNSIPALPADRGSRLRLVACGRFSKEKNFTRLIEAVSQFGSGEIELDLIGAGPEHAAMRKAAVGHLNVYFMGRIDDPSKFLTNCHAVIVPSHHEAFGLVATEARMAARPILVADVDGLPEQVGTAGLARPMRTASEIAEAIREFRELPLREMGQAGRREVAGQADRIVAGWKAVFASAERKERPAWFAPQRWRRQAA